MTADPSDGTAALRPTSVKPGRPSLARTLLAFIVAPVVTSLSVAALFTAVSLQETGDIGIGLVLYGSIALLFALPSVIVVGTPAYLLLRRAGRDTTLGLVALGAGTGLLGMSLISLWTASSVGFAQVLPTIGMAGVAGAIGGWVFALVRGSRD